MKIGIVTIYKCYNYGSFYQAYGLQRYLEDLGHEVSFIPIDSLYNKKYRLRKQFDRNIKRDIFSLKLLLSYLKDWKMFNIAKSNKKDYDLVIIGSDEIWNIENKTFVPANEYYGLSLSTENVISYASCVGRSTIDSFKYYPQFLEGIKKIRAVSARDDATEKLVSQVTGNQNVQRVIDPSFLFDFRKIEKKCSEKEYILVYTYDGSWGFSEDKIKATKEFAKKRGLSLISVGFRNTWCDKWIAASPREFLGYLKNANYVITDTFHGTALSIQYQKQFVSMGKGKAKVESLLSEFSLCDRVFDENRSIEDITKNNIDYEKVNLIIEDKKNQSKIFLQNNI